MTSILDLNANSSDSDEDDCDYVPPEGELSDVSDDDHENEAAIEDNESPVKRTKRKRKKKCVVAQEEEKVVVIKPEHSEAEEKQRVENIWKSFLDDVGKTPTKKRDPVQKSAHTCSTSSDKTIIADSKSDSDKPAVEPKKKTITEIFEFAGESVTVTKEIDEDSNKDTNTINSTPKELKTESKAEINPNPVARKRQGGLGSLLGSIMNKKQKMTTLEKSLHDWKSFKKEEGIEEDLEKFNKGKGGFLEKQAFLQRSDLRQYELEKTVRLSSKTKR